MDRFFDNLRKSVVNYKLDSCCFVAPLRTGLLIIGYFNVMLSVILIVGTATESFAPTISHVQELVMEEASKSTCILVPTAELAFSVLLLCATHRDDVVLLRVYMYYGVAAAALSVLVYSIVIAGISVLYVIVIVISITYQIYVVFLVRSLLVEIKLQNISNKNGAVPSETPKKPVPDAEAPDEPTTPDLEPQPKQNADVKTNAETVHEAPKLKTIEEGPKNSEAATSGSAVRVTITSATAPTASKIDKTAKITSATAKENIVSPMKSGANVERTDVAEKENDNTAKDGDAAKDTATKTKESGTEAAKSVTVRSRGIFWK